MTKRILLFKNVHDIEQWKSELLGHVLDAFASSNQGDIQKSVSAWRWSEELPFPTPDAVRINGGCMTFDALVAGNPVFFSLWYTFGEVRVGVRVPRILLEASIGHGSNTIENRLKHAYDGRECHKVTGSADSKFFDWIFRDEGEGFASFMTGMRATQDPYTELAIASRLADVLIHLYMATMNIIIESGGMKVTFKQIRSQLSVSYTTLQVKGNQEAFRFWIRRFGTIEKETPWTDGMTRYLLSGDKEVVNVPLGDVQVDGDWFSIIDRVPQKAQDLMYAEQT